MALFGKKKKEEKKDEFKPETETAGDNIEKSDASVGAPTRTT